MKKLLVIGASALALAGVAGFALANTTPSYALNGQTSANTRQGYNHGNGYQAMLESHAAILGMSVEDLQKALETKTLSQIAVDKGMTQETFQAKMTEAAKARWEARGLSEDEIKERLAEQQTRREANAADHEFGSGAGDHRGGYGRHNQ